MIKHLIVASMFLFFVSFASAQWVESETFIEVSSQQAGSPEEGCLVACMSGMLVSINDSRIGTDPAPIINSMLVELRRTGNTFPYPSYDVMHAVIKFLERVL